MHVITVDELISWWPCPDNPRERIEQLFGDGLTPLQALDLDIPAKDLLWGAYSYLARHDRDGFRSCLLASVDRAVRAHCLGCGAPEVEGWARRWLDRAEGWDAAQHAQHARDAAQHARYAARYAALAARYAALAALVAARYALNASRYALNAALYALAALDARYAARELDEQINDVRNWLRGVDANCRADQ